ncbi:V-type ATP synthase subunit D [candidate division WOR-3 bacterium]|nr:V-type ATP synthase subunit D [candidate division WOR-3 bacterium]
MNLILEVNPTRQELLKLRRRIVIARRGHKLLKDKQDELMRRLLSMIENVKSLRIKVEKHLAEAMMEFAIAKGGAEPGFVEAAIMFPKKKVSIEVGRKQIMNLRVPSFARKVSGDIICYGLAQTTVELDNSLDALDNVTEELLDLAEKEKTVSMLADEVAKTRRRVNTLEYVLIPNLEETISYIRQKLAEMERSNLSRLMKVKDIIRER